MVSSSASDGQRTRPVHAQQSEKDGDCISVCVCPFNPFTSIAEPPRLFAHSTDAWISSGGLSSRESRDDGR